MSFEVLETTAPEVTEVPVEVSTEVTPAPVPELPELTHIYQPADEQGRPLGGRQVIKYRTPEELAQKLTQQNIELVRKLREVTWKQRLGISDTEEIPSEAARFDSPIEFSARELSADERVKISRDLLDPERFEEANATLFEANVGVKPEVFRKRMSQIEINELRRQAKDASDAFMKANPDYYKCQDNADKLTGWMVKYNLVPTQENFQLAYDRLRAAGLLLEAPNVREDAPTVPTPVIPVPAAPVTEEQTPTNTQSAEVPNSRITTEEPPQAKRPVAAIPTGLTRNQGSDAGIVRPLGDEIVYEHIIRDNTGKPTGEKKVYKGRAAIEMMPADEFKRRVNTDRGFQQKADKLLSEPPKKQ
jgi:hypothetical protein